MATAEFSKFAGILSAAFLQHHIPRFEIWRSSIQLAKTRPGADCDSDHELKPDILECEVKWDLGSITMNKASGGDGIAVEVF